jgi:hypothetical protein
MKELSDISTRLKYVTSNNDWLKFVLELENLKEQVDAGEKGSSTADPDRSDCSERDSL